MYERNMTFIDQFTGKSFKQVLAGLILLDIVSFISLHTIAEPILAICIVVAAVIVAIKSPSWLFPIAIAEIISTSNGHSLNLFIGDTSIGVRILIFVVLMAATAVRVFKTRTESVPKRLILPSVLVVVLVAVSTLQGMISGHPLVDIYKDANGYMAIGYVWAAYVWTRSGILKHRLLQAVGAGVVWIVAKTLLFVLIFGHLHPKTLDPIYLWIRDTRLGEVTLQVGNIYRVFLQSQWFVVPAMLVSGSYLLFSKEKMESGVRVVILVIIATLIASLSRSFWVGSIAGVGVLLGYVVYRKVIARFGVAMLHTAVLSVAAVSLLWVLIAIPIFQTSSTSIFSSILRDRATQSSDVALDSRRQLVEPLLRTISESPVAGHGLGKNVVYTTQDPRYIDAHQTDVVSSYAFEWGWLDIAVKFGVVGLILFAVFLFVIVRMLMKAAKEDKPRAWLYIGLIASVVALVTTHMFSPYLNHPIGWGTIAVIVALPPTIRKVSEPIHIRNIIESRSRSAAHGVARKTVT